MMPRLSWLYTWLMRPYRMSQTAFMVLFIGIMVVEVVAVLLFIWPLFVVIPLGSVAIGGFPNVFRDALYVNARRIKKWVRKKPDKQLKFAITPALLLLGPPAYISGVCILFVVVPAVLGIAVAVLIVALLLVGGVVYILGVSGLLLAKLYLILWPITVPATIAWVCCPGKRNK